MHIYFIFDVIKNGGQVLYLLPEIALTTQIVSRLQRVFGEKIVVYHSKMSNNERVEIWRAVANGTPITLGARSSLFLPLVWMPLTLLSLTSILLTSAWNIA